MDGNCLVFSKDYVLLVTNQIEASKHAHEFIQFFIAPGGIRVSDSATVHSGNCLVVSRGIAHSVVSQNGRLATLLVDPLSDLGRSAQAETIGRGIVNLDMKTEDYRMLFENNFTVKQVNEFTVHLKRQFQQQDRIQLSDRVKQIYTTPKTDLTDIAYCLGVSASRLSHQFKEETGIALKKYLLLKQLKKAYAAIADGDSITRAAHDAGFYSSSHLALTHRRLTGMSARKVIQNSVFLKV